jgi:hypothetical protein
MSTRHLDHSIRSAGFQLLRDRKHHVYHHTELNKILVTASTPSDQRAEANIIAQVAKLTGRKKKDLLGGSSNKRQPQSSQPSSVVIAPPPPAQTAETAVAALPQLIVVEALPFPPPLTAGERKYLRRLEKHESQRKEKEMRQRNKYQYWVATVHAHLLRLVDEYRLTPDKDKIADEYEAAAVALYLIARKAGHHEAELMVADCMRDGSNTTLFIVRVGRHYLDLFSASVHDTPRWPIDFGESVAKVEVWGSLKVDKEGDGYVIRDSEV